MDGHFVNNITIGPPVVRSIKKVSKIPLDVHLMIEKPEKYIDAFLDAGSDILTIHVESTTETKNILQKIRSRGVKAGLTLRPRTSATEVLPYLEMIDLILVMTVEPGFGGQKFMEDQLPKLKFLSQEIQKRNLNIDIEVDGGINLDTAQLCRKNGANVFVAGHYVFSGDYKKNIHSLRLK
jgi:ribulose-phosphate 3-epimerase